MQLAPWLRPTDTLGAIRSGASLGLQLRQQGAQEEQAAAALRQREDELFAQNERAKEAMQERKDEAANAIKEKYGESVVLNPQGQVDIVASAAKANAKGDKEAIDALAGLQRAYSAFSPQPAPIQPSAPAGSLAPVPVPGRIPPNEVPDPNPADMVPIPGQPAPAAAALAPRAGAFPDVTGLSAPAARMFGAHYPQAMALQEREATARMSNERMAAQSDQAHLDRLAAIAGREKTTGMNIEGRAALAGTKPATLTVGERTLVSNYGRSVANKELAKAQIDDKMATLEDDKIPYPVRYAAAQELYKTLNSSDFGRDALNTEEVKRIGQLLEVTGPVQWIKSGKKPLPDWDGFLQQIKIKSKDLEKETEGLKNQIEGIQASAEKRRGVAQPASVGTPTRVNTQSEYDALPKGARYVDSNGKMATKK